MGWEESKVTLVLDFEMRGMALLPGPRKVLTTGVTGAPLSLV
jgi:hypothetical protein